MNWFYRYKAKGKGDEEALETHLTSSQTGVIISRETQGNGRQFAKFDTHEHFLRYFQKCDLDDRTFYEVIQGDKPQKIYFDIDISKDSGMSLAESKDLIKLMLAGIIKVTNLPESTQIQVFRSAEAKEIKQDTLEPNSKISYHLVLPNYYLKSAEHNREVYRKVLELIPVQYHQYLDMLYSNFQQFRTYGSHKTNRPKAVKRLDLSLSTWKNSNSSFISTMMESLITNVTDSKLIEIEIAPKPTRQIKFNLDIIEYEELSQLVEDKLGCFRVVEGENNGLVQLRRTSRDVECIICKDCHQNENGFLTISQDGSVRFHCFRDSKKNPDKPSAPVIGYIKVDAVLDSPQPNFTREISLLKKNPIKEPKPQPYNFSAWL